MNSTTKMDTITSTRKIKSFIYNLGVDLVGIADMSKIENIPVGLNIDLTDLFRKYPFAIVINY
jgi:hypothetical protein